MEKHYRHTIDSAKEAKAYFEKLSSTLATSDIARWNQEIIIAEKYRLEKPSAMDIMACQQITKAPETAGDNIKDNNDGVEWIMLGFGIEERQ